MLGILRLRVRWPGRILSFFKVYIVFASHPFTVTRSSAGRVRQPALQPAQAAFREIETEGDA